MYEKPEVKDLGSLSELTLQPKTLGQSDGVTLVGIPGVPDGTPIGDVPSGSV